MIVLSAEKEALDDARWRVLRAAIAPEAASPSTESLPGQLVRALNADAEAHRYGALCARGLRRLGVADPSPEPRERRALYASIMLQSHADRLGRALDEARVPYVFLKGLVNDIAYYGGQGMRETSDLDVLVDAALTAQAEAALAGLGATRFVFPGAQHTADQSHGHAYAWPRDGAAPLAIDVHFRLTDPPLTDFSPIALDARCLHRGPDGGQRMGLAPRFQLAYAACNLALDGLSGRIKQTLDAAQIVRHHPDALPGAAQIARDAGAGAALYGMLRLVGERLGVPVDTNVMRAIAPGAKKRALTEALFGVHAAPLSLRGMPTRLLLPDHGGQNAKAAVRWGMLRALDAADTVSRRLNRHRRIGEPG